MDQVYQYLTVNAGCNAFRSQTSDSLGHGTLMVTYILLLDLYIKGRDQHRNLPPLSSALETEHYIIVNLWAKYV